MEQMQAALERCEALMFVSSTVRAEFLAAFDLDVNRCFHVPNCSRFEDRFQPRNRSRAPRRGIYVGSIQARKGYDLLVQRAPLGVSVDVYGPMSDKGLAERLRKTKGVRLKGVIDHDKLGKRMLGYDCLMLFSYAEGCPYVLIEAASLGIPCFSSNANGNREVVVDGLNGNIFSHADGDFDDKWRKFLSADLDRYGRNAREHYMRHFSKERFETRLGSALARIPALEARLSADLRAQSRESCSHEQSRSGAVRCGIDP